MSKPWVYLLLMVMCLYQPSAMAEEFYCEVMAVEGSATLTNADSSGVPLKEGDILKVDDRIEVASGGYVDLAYDRDWNNITRIEENSKILLRSLYPTTVDLEEGAVFAKLRSLPKDSSFDVKTPTAIASVRGTEYRTTYVDGQTEVYNVSESDVFVYGVSDGGERQGEPIIVQNSHKTQIARRGQPPAPPQKMAQADFVPAHRAREMIERRVTDNVAKGRLGKIQDIGKIERLQARSNAQRMSDNRGALVSGEGVRERRPDPSSDERPRDGFEGRGLGQPYFPSDENRRSGGPEPAGFPDRKWQSGSEKANEGPGAPPKAGQPEGRRKDPAKPQGQRPGPGKGKAR